MRAELIKAREPLHPRAPSLSGLKSIYHVDAAALADALTNVCKQPWLLVAFSVAIMTGNLDIIFTCHRMKVIRKYW